MTLQQKYEYLISSAPRTHYVYVSKEVITSGSRKEIKREVKFDEDGDPVLSVSRKTSQSAMARAGFFPFEAFAAQDKLRNKLQTAPAKEEKEEVKAESTPEKKTSGRKKKEDESIQGI